MVLDDLCTTIDALELPVAGVAEHPERETVLEVRSAVTAAITDHGFLEDCLFRELALLRRGVLRRTLIPFVVLPRIGVGIALGYHPPGGRPGPHEHTAWTVTAVWRNALEMATFDREESYRRQELVPKNTFHARSGRVGFVYEPCIHEPRNPTTQWTLSLHVVSPRDGEPPAEDVDGSPPPGLGTRPRGDIDQITGHPYASVLAARQRQVFAGELLRAVASVPGPRAQQLRADLGEVASPRVRRFWTDASTDREVEQANRTLTRVDAALSIDCRETPDGTALYAHTASGPAQELVVNDVARAALLVAAREKTFAVDDLPGGLSTDERTSLADALEETGLFTRRQS
ncbi:hypothetical protein [Pseudonocardia lacus]|uniref:hypothetical protein n=1 Tax=Pseudonocardia lacus TaxID=2835865 RepID=UPI001BDCDA7F|nr:hypothetical protein [Pseudonocardia lacus]